MLFSINSLAVTSLSIQSVNGNPNNEIIISGADFGSSCPKCEVIVEYGGGFKYGYSAKSWSDKIIKLTIDDLNKGLNVQLYVKTAENKSNTVNYAIKPTIIPSRKLNRLVQAGSVKDILMFEIKSDLAVGDRGDELYNVNSPPAACNAKGYIFERAELVTGNNRFGEAKIISVPKAGCTSCVPVKVRWYHEPTGSLHYQVHIYRREVSGVCNDKVRQ